MASVSEKRKASEDLSPDVSASKRVQLLSSQNKKRQRPSFMGPQTMVQVNVSLGTEDKKQEFLVYKQFICYYSPFFDAVFNGNFEKGVNQSIDIVDINPKAFGLFVNWLYTQNVVPEFNEPLLATLVDLWLLGDRCLIPRLQNEALVALEERRLQKSVRISCVLFRVYGNTLPGSPLRRYLVQRTALSVPPRKALTQRYDHYPPEMLFDMFDFLRTRQGLADWEDLGFSEDELKQFFVEERETGPKKDLVHQLHPTEQKTL